MDSKPAKAHAKKTKRAKKMGTNNTKDVPEPDNDKISARRAMSVFDLVQRVDDWNAAIRHDYEPDIPSYYYANQQTSRILDYLHRTKSRSLSSSRESARDGSKDGGKRTRRVQSFTDRKHSSATHRDVGSKRSRVPKDTGSRHNTGVPTDTGSKHTNKITHMGSRGVSRVPTDTGSRHNTGVPTDTGSRRCSRVPMGTGSRNKTGVPTGTGSRNKTGVSMDTGSRRGPRVPSDTKMGIEVPTDTDNLDGLNSDLELSISKHDSCTLLLNRLGDTPRKKPREKEVHFVAKDEKDMTHEHAVSNSHLLQSPHQSPPPVTSSPSEERERKISYKVQLEMSLPTLKCPSITYPVPKRDDLQDRLFCAYMRKRTKKRKMRIHRMRKMYHNARLGADATARMKDLSDIRDIDLDFNLLDLISDYMHYMNMPRMPRSHPPVPPPTPPEPSYPPMVFLTEKGDLIKPYWAKETPCKTPDGTDCKKTADCSGHQTPLKNQTFNNAEFQNVPGKTPRTRYEAQTSDFNECRTSFRNQTSSDDVFKDSLDTSAATQQPLGNKSRESSKGSRPSRNRTCHNSDNQNLLLISKKACKSHQTHDKTQTDKNCYFKESQTLFQTSIDEGICLQPMSGHSIECLAASEPHGKLRVLGRKLSLNQTCSIYEHSDVRATPPCSQMSPATSASEHSHLNSRKGQRAFESQTPGAASQDGPVRPGKRRTVSQALREKWGASYPRRSHAPPRYAWEDEENRSNYNTFATTEKENKSNCNMFATTDEENRSNKPNRELPIRQTLQITR